MDYGVTIILAHDINKKQRNTKENERGERDATGILCVRACSKTTWQRKSNSIQHHVPGWKHHLYIWFVQYPIDPNDVCFPKQPTLMEI